MHAQSFRWDLNEFNMLNSKWNQSIQTKKKHVQCKLEPKWWTNEPHSNHTHKPHHSPNFKMSCDSPPCNPSMHWTLSTFFLLDSFVVL